MNTKSPANIGSFLKFDYWLSKYATNQYEIHSFAKEWIWVIAIAFVVKVLTMVLSLYSGYSYVFTLLYNVVPTIAVEAAIGSLILLELLNAFVLGKFFKFAYRRAEYASRVLVIGVFLFLLYSASFHISTQGLATRQAGKVDQSVNITNLHTIEIGAINDRYNALIAAMDTEIQTIKDNPRGAGNALTIYQQNSIADYTKQKLTLLKEQQNELRAAKNENNFRIAENSKTTTNTANQYWVIMALIMLVQFVANGFLVFSWGQIRNEMNKDSTVKDLASFAIRNTDALLENLIQNRIQSYGAAMQKNAFLPAKTETETVQKTELQTELQTETVNQNFNTHGIRGNFTEPLETPQTVPFETETEPQKETVLASAKTVLGFRKKTETETVKRTCLTCKTDISHKDKRAKYCSDRCRMAAHNFNLKS